VDWSIHHSVNSVASPDGANRMTQRLLYLMLP
jgi:hypothetical protein